MGIATSTCRRCTVSTSCGNPYHLNTEEEPELGDWPKDPGFNERYLPRGVLDCLASGVDDPTVDPRFVRVGKQVIRDTGPLHSKRMETVDDEFVARTQKFMADAVKEGEPIFAWYAPTRMHIYTHLRPGRETLAALAAAGGVDNVAAKLLASHKVHIDGVNNLAHWTSDAPSARYIVYYYNESELTAVRIGNWKSHFAAREGFFDYNKPAALIFNLRMDPFEKHDGQINNDISMRLGIAWGGQVQDALAAHMESLAKFPPRQKGGSLRPGGDK